MVEGIARRLSFANVISILALFIALGGTSYAAIKLPRNSVGTKQIKRNAVTSAKVQDGSLLGGDFKAGQLPVGPQGSQGATGPAGAKGAAGADGADGADGANGADGADGAPGSAAAFARVAANGTPQPNVAGFPPQVKGVEAADIVKGEAAAATGTYCFGDIGFKPASAVVSLDNADAALAARDRIISVALDRGEDLGDCPGTHNTARVRIIDASDAAAADARFFIWFEK